MKKYFPLLFTLYTLCIQAFLIYTTIFYGILADERKLTDPSQNFLSLVLLFIFTLVIQIIFVLSLLSKKAESV